MDAPVQAGAGAHCRRCRSPWQPRL